MDYIAFFTEVWLSKKQANVIIDCLKQQGMGAERMERIVRKIRRHVEKNELRKLINKVDKTTIESMVAELLPTPPMASYSDDQPDEWYQAYFQFKEGKEYKEGDEIDIQFMKTGKRDHPAYGKFAITPSDLDQVKKNFDDDVRGIRIMINENHKNRDRALGRVKKLYKKWKEKLFWAIELTKRGARLLSEGSYAYFSPEIKFVYKDPTSGKIIRNLLTGGGFTNIPFFKKMQGLMASESADQATDPNNVFILTLSSSMNKLLELVQKFSENRDDFTEQDQQEVARLFSELPEGQQNDGYLRVEVGEIAEYQFNDWDEDGDDDTTTGDDDGDKKDDTTDDNGDDNKDDKSGKGTNGDDAGDGDDDTNGDDTTGSDGDGDGDDGKTDDVTVKASEFAEIKAKADMADKLLADKTKRDVQDQVENYIFSEKDNTGFVVPNQKDKLVEFAAGLTDDQRKDFYEIMDGVNKAHSIFSEIGEYGSKDPTENMNEDQKLDYQVKKFAEENDMDPVNDYDVILRQIA